MSTIPKPGRIPKNTAPLFHLGTNHTDKYGTIEVDHADVLRVMETHKRRGRHLAIDVEHATQRPEGKPADWQESHGWADLGFDGKTITAAIDYNENGARKLSDRKVAYDSPVITLWRGNHLNSIEMLSLVKDPARNGSIPLCMSNANAATPAEPTPRVKNLQRLHTTAGEFISALTAAQGDQDLRGLTEEAAAALVSPVAKINEMLQQSGAAAEVKEERAAAEAATTSTTPEPQKLMSAQPDALSVLGAEVMAKLGVKSPDEALGKLQALQDNTQTLMSSQKDAGNTDTKLLLLSGLQAGKIYPDEVEKYKGASPQYVQALMSNRLPGVNVKSAAPVSETPAASDTDHVASTVHDMIQRVAGVKL